MMMLMIMAAGFLFLVPTFAADEQGKLQGATSNPAAAQPIELPQSNQESQLPRQEESAEQPASPLMSAPGHPLDPRDVDILTGKTRREARESRLYQYWPMLGERNYGVRYDRYYGSRRLHTPFLQRFFFRGGHVRPFRATRRPRAFFFLSW